MTHIDWISRQFSSDSVDLNSVVAYVWKNNIPYVVADLMKIDNFMLYCLYVLKELPRMKNFPIEEVKSIDDSNLSPQEIRFRNEIISNSVYYDGVQ